MSLLKVTHLSIHTTQDPRVLVNDVSFEINPGEAVGLVGESGSGKTLSALSILGLLPRGVTATSGEIEFQGKSLNQIDSESMRKIRGNEIAMIYQDPMTALNPVMKLGDQLMEVIDSHPEAGNLNIERVKEVLRDVGIPDVDRAIQSYPHEFSGGMRQRIVIAMSLLLSPKLLIADEPTTALDVTIQQQILALVAEERQKRKLSMLWITHDLGVVANLVDRLHVMYAGRIVESGTVSEIFTNPRHPYTQGLISSLPSPRSSRREKLSSIPGVPEKPWLVGNTCAFSPRCAFAQDKCRQELPQIDATQGHRVACFYPLGAKS